MRIGPPQDASARRRLTAFTLIELIVVMTMMVIVMSVVSPQLKGFFTGRDLDNEAHRFLSLTRLGQTRAVAEGTPVDLWMNTKLGTYGLAADGGYSETQTNPVTYALAAGVEMGVVLARLSSETLTQSNVWTLPQTKMRGYPTIRFQPDGMIGESSPQTVKFRQGKGSEVWIVENPNHLRYEIQNGNANTRR